MSASSTIAEQTAPTAPTVQHECPGKTESREPLILVVDDLESNALLLEDMLQASNYRTAIATDGLSALEIAAANPPDLILLDFVMPGVSGVETCRRIKQSPWGERIPVVFVTGASDKDSLVDAFGAGGVDYLSKPVYPQELLARIGVHLRLRKAEQELKTRNRELEEAAKELSVSNSRLAELSRTDGLTGLLNRRTWDHEAEQVHAMASRYDSAYSILMVDVDLFKRYNDNYGHQAGDECLVNVSGAIAKALRQVDIVGRYGGEEFIALLPETPGTIATQVAERIRETIWNLAMPHEKSPAHRVTISIGVADGLGRSLAATIGAADHRLYMAKRHGRNVVLGPPSAAASEVPGDSAPQASPAGQANKRSKETRHILLISSDEAAFEACNSRLDRRAFHVHHRTDWAAAHATDDDVAWSAFILDVRSAEPSMLECLEEIRAGATTRLVPVIALCNHSSQEVRRAVDQGFDDVIDDLESDYQLKTRIATMCQLRTERAALERSYQMRGEQVRVLAYTVDCAQRASQARTFEQVCDILMQGAAEITASQYVAISLCNAGGLARTVEWDAQRQEPLSMEAGYQLPEAVSQQLLESEVAIETEPAMPPQQPEEQNANKRHFTSAFHLRLEVGGELLGVLTAHRRLHQPPFTEHEVELYRVFACLTASLVSESVYHHARDEAVGAFVKALATTAETRDKPNSMHVHRVSRIAGLIAERLRTSGHPEPISDEFIHNLTLAAPLHDIGKMAVPDSLLKKPGKLTVHEMAIVKMHCELGVDIFRRLVEDSRTLPFATVAVDVIMSHHERFDGRGYPHSLAGTKIPLASRIVAVADAYDAITNDRVYRKARTHEEAIKIIERERGKQFDPAVLDAFFDQGDKISQLCIPDDESDEVNPLVV